MPRPVFQPGLVYPRDRVGEYTEREGTVIKVVVDVSVRVTMRTKDWGDITGYRERPMPLPQVGDWVRMRVYRYEDNRVIEWSAPPSIPVKRVPFWKRIGEWL